MSQRQKSALAAAAMVAVSFVAGFFIGNVDGDPPEIAIARPTQSRPIGTRTSPIPPPSPSPTVPGEVGDAIGYVGCSNSASSVEGYHLVGGQAMWPFIRNYGGGTLRTWSQNIGGASDQWWSSFIKQQALMPANTFWFQMCSKAADVNDNEIEQAKAIIAEIKTRVPGATVFVSALNEFVAPHVCFLCGENGPALMQETADAVVASGEAQAGPDVGTLIAYCTTSECGVSSSGAMNSTNQVTSDGCHPNTKGKQDLGTVLKTFFG
jgi:hypothetical protein